MRMHSKKGMSCISSRKIKREVDRKTDIPPIFALLVLLKGHLHGISTIMPRIIQKDGG